ncbi:MAG: hypothetical protein JWN78_1299 [Bacteroidota bacterium]|nr:hypothetical protein [Bacteroidota bacterium]
MVYFFNILKHTDIKIHHNFVNKSTFKCTIKSKPGSEFFFGYLLCR